VCIFRTFSVHIRQVIYIEMAVQGGVSQGDPIAPPKPDSSAQLRTADLVVMDRDVQALIIDLEVLIGLVMVSYVIISVLICTVLSYSCDAVFNHVGTNI